MVSIRWYLECLKGQLGGAGSHCEPSARMILICMCWGLFPPTAAQMVADATPLIIRLRRPGNSGIFLLKTDPSFKGRLAGVDAEGARSATSVLMEDALRCLHRGLLCGQLVERNTHET